MQGENPLEMGCDSMDEWNNPFPHDGEGHGECTGLGCDCDEKRYGYRGGGNKGGSGGGIWIAIIVGLVLGYGINELLGAIVLIGVIVYIMLCR